MIFQYPAFKTCVHIKVFLKTMYDKLLNNKQTDIITKKVYAYSSLLVKSVAIGKGNSRLAFVYNYVKRMT